jgi:3-deoxy-D-manno-octulosonic-acid transferase
MSTGLPIYTIAIHIYRWSIKLAAVLGLEKAQRFLELRKPGWRRPEGRVVWIHAASAGEANQALPLMPGLSKAIQAEIVLSVFSPSGFTFHQENPEFTTVNLPLDTRQNARDFIRMLAPELAIFIRNELWQHYLLELNAKKIPVFLVNAPEHVLHPGLPIFKGYVRGCLRRFDAIFPSGEGQGTDLSGLRISPVCGDTKWESARMRAFQGPDPVLKAFAGAGDCVVAGSTWLKEETYLKKWLNAHPESSSKILLAPHQISPERMDSLTSTFDDFCFYSRFTDADRHKKVMILDRYGILQNAYSYGTVAVIGGGFGKGIHNILEAGVHGLPVVFGPNHGRFPEAGVMLQAGTAFSARNYPDFDERLTGLLSDKERLRSIREKQTRLAEQHLGISERIVEAIVQTVSPRTSGQ